MEKVWKTCVREKERRRPNGRYRGFFFVAHLYLLEIPKLNTKQLTLFLLPE